MITTFVVAAALALHADARTIPVYPFQQQVNTCLAGQSKNRSTNIDNNDDHYTMRYRATGCSGLVDIDGKLRFSSDYNHITGISDGGRIRIEETANGVTRRLEAKPSSNGLAFEWSIDGKSRPYDADARAWFDNWTLVLFRELGFAADERASFMLRTGGVNAILREVGFMTSDYVQSSYLGTAMEKGNLSAGDVQRVLDVAATSIDSDYYAANILTRAAKGVTFNTAARQSYLKAAARIDSDYYKESVLSELVKNGRLDASETAEVLRQAKMVASDYYRMNLLTGVIGRSPLDESMRAAILASTADIESDYYKLGVLHKLIATKNLSDAGLVALLNTSRTIDSDYYASELLVDVAKTYTLKGAARDAFTASMNRIGSEYYRSSVAAALRTN